MFQVLRGWNGEKATWVAPSAISAEHIFRDTWFRVFRPSLVVTPRDWLFHWISDKLQFLRGSCLFMVRELSCESVPSRHRARNDALPLALITCETALLDYRRFHYQSSSCLGPFRIVWTREGLGRLLSGVRYPQILREVALCLSCATAPDFSRDVHCPREIDDPSFL